MHPVPFSAHIFSFCGWNVLVYDEYGLYAHISVTLKHFYTAPFCSISHNSFITLENLPQDLMEAVVYLLSPHLSTKKSWKTHANRPLNRLVHTLTHPSISTLMKDNSVAFNPSPAAWNVTLSSSLERSQTRPVYSWTPSLLHTAGVG